MINTQELRLGNYIQTDYEGVLTVREISSRHIHASKTFLLPSGRFGIDSIYPIPLTEGWLTRFGFELDEEERNWNHPEYTIYRHKDKSIYLGVEGRICYYDYNDDDDYYSSYYPFDFVHDLQNYIFARHKFELVLEN